MIPKRLQLLATVSFVVVIAGLAVDQMSRPHPQPSDARLNPSACTADAATVAPSGRGVTAPAQSPVALRLDYAGAEALIDALERDSLASADVDSLLRVPGLCAMVANIDRFFPGIGVPKFSADLRGFVRTRKGDDNDPYYRLRDVWQARAAIRSVVGAIRTNERELVQQIVSELERYRPDSGALAITGYFVAGGVSTGFAFEDDPTSLFANLVTAQGDLNGIMFNMEHEAYHVMQARAQTRAGLDPRWISAGSMPPIDRLFAGTLFEGTANYVADPTRSTATGSSMDLARQRYRRNADPKRIARNFALFDDVLIRLKSGRVTWEKANREGFSNDNDDAFYFVGYEMTKAIEKYCGRDCVRRLFDAPPVEFFRRYFALYRQYPEISGRFSAETERVIAGR